MSIPPSSPRRRTFEAYPRDFERDRRLAEEVGVDVIFSPDNREMYPEGYQTYVEVEGVTNNLCGISRPRFFRGVTTVCTKLFHIVKPHVTIFGKKDFQQYVTIKRMVPRSEYGHRGHRHGYDARTRRPGDEFAECLPEAGGERIRPEPEPIPCPGRRTLRQGGTGCRRHS